MLRQYHYLCQSRAASNAVANEFDEIIFIFSYFQKFRINDERLVEYCFDLVYMHAHRTHFVYRLGPANIVVCIDKGPTNDKL